MKDKNEGVYKFYEQRWKNLINKARRIEKECGKNYELVGVRIRREVNPTRFALLEEMEKVWKTNNLSVERGKKIIEKVDKVWRW